MKLYSTNNHDHVVSIRQAILHSLPPDNGLYMPERFPQLSTEFLSHLDQYSFKEIALEVASSFLSQDVPKNIIESIVSESINFPAPVITIDERLSILELFHGPTLAFKDFGARFMARIMNYFWSHEKGKLRILVATSGDTGGAVASGFHGLDNIEVIILYPKGKVSQLQENQLTTWGDNIKAIEIQGDFDACQKMVKQAFLDKQLNQKLHLSSANSINIARLIPQSFYYFNAVKQMPKNSKVTFCVPSGNFGNLTAGLFAKKMGLSFDHMIAATNINDVVPQYLKNGEFTPKNAQSTLSNAMDIGNPSNFSRILDMYGSTWNHIKNHISGYSFSDEETIEEIIRTHQNSGYVLDPHTAVGVLAARQYLSTTKENNTIVLSTAHPIKFKSEIESSISFNIPYPSSVHRFFNKKSHKIPMDAEYNKLKDYLLTLEQ